MTAEPVLTLAWLVVAHLAADFIIQTERIATDKFTTGSRAWRALGAHVLGVGACLIPVAVGFGLNGLIFLVVVALAHGAIDRTKIVWTRHAEAVAIARAHREHETASPSEGLGSAWTPIPAALFAGDQIAHIVITGLAWAIWLAATPMTSSWTSFATTALAGWDPAVVHRTVLTMVVLTALVIVNVRAAALFVATLVHPREVVTGHEAPVAEGAPRTRTRPGNRPSPLRIGAAIGVLERLLIVTLVLTGATAAIGFVVAAKTLARFKQLDDRQFAEYYLLGTLASVTVGLLSGLLAQLALR